MIASFSALGIDLPSIALIVLHSFVGSVLWSNVSTNRPHLCLLCSFVILVISSFMAGEVPMTPACTWWNRSEEDL